MLCTTRDPAAITTTLLSIRFAPTLPMHMQTIYPIILPMELRQVRKPLLRFTRMCLRNMDCHRQHLVGRRSDRQWVFLEPPFGAQTVAFQLPFTPCTKLKQITPDARQHLGAALLAATASVICIAFIGGCFYPYFPQLWSAHYPSPARATYNDAGLAILLEFGLITAMTVLPGAIALTGGVGYPLFRLWVRRGYSNIAAYVGGGIIVAMIGALIVAAAHTFAGFLLGKDFVFAMLLIAVSGPVAGFVVWYVLRRSIQGLQPAIKS
jgi:hypothetical protein